MSHIYWLASQQSQTYFDRREFDNLLSVYSMGVANGDWRDYALNHSGDQAAFFIYRYANEQPTYVILKKKSGKIYNYLLFSGNRKLVQSNDISDIIRSITDNYN